VLESKWVKRKDVALDHRARLAPAPKASVANVTFTFSELKYFFECAYQFKLRVLYGFNAPLSEALGYGKSLHDALADVHLRAMRGQAVGPADVPQLVATHLHLPYAYPALRDKLEETASQVLLDYLADNAKLFDRVEYAEKAIEISLGNGVSVAGRVDLIYRRDTDEVSIVDLKSNSRAQAEDVTETQLHIYSMGYEALTGRAADYVEIYELEDRKRKPRAVDSDLADDVRARVHAAAGALRWAKLDPEPHWTKCRVCDYRRVCSSAV
jgi:DNA helicase-2/ATP-dependent DNA helicase PcrA